MIPRLVIPIGSLLILFLIALQAYLSGAGAQGPIVGPGNLILCPNIATLAVGPSTITQLMGGTAGQSISICGWHVTNTGATGTFALSSANAGSSCGTGVVQFVPPQNVTSTAPATDHIDYAFYTLPVGQALCITPSVATIAAVLYYNKF